MKNPFTHIEVRSRKADFALMLYWEGRGASVRLDKEQTQYAAHAINQHEKLVEALRMSLAAMRANIAMAGVKDEVVLAKAIPVAAALLDEEKP